MNCAKLCDLLGRGSRSGLKMQALNRSSTIFCRASSASSTTVLGPLWIAHIAIAIGISVGLIWVAEVWALVTVIADTVAVTIKGFTRIKRECVQLVVDAIIVIILVNPNAIPSPSVSKLSVSLSGKRSYSSLTPSPSSSRSMSSLIPSRSLSPRSVSAIPANDLHYPSSAPRIDRVRRQIYQHPK